MALGTWKMRYSFKVYIPGNEGGDANLFAFNTDYSKAIGLNQAVSSAQAMVRRLQALGTDCRAEVKGKPIGANATTPVLALDAAFQDEEVYAFIDTPDYRLKRAISLANRDADASGDALPAGDDIEDAVLPGP